MHNGIAKLLSVLKLERDGFVLTYDTRTTWHIHFPDEKFIALDSELWGVCNRFCYIGISQPLKQSTLSLVNTVRENYEGFTRHEVEKDILALKAHGRVGNPSCAEFVKMVNEKTVKNLPVTPIDVSNALAIFGPNLSRLKGGTVCTKLSMVDTEINI